jgi:hypothetical protein
MFLISSSSDKRKRRLIKSIEYTEDKGQYAALSSENKSPAETNV